MLDIPPLGTLNLHTALLPKYRGLMPSFWVLKNEEKETGVSVFLIVNMTSGDSKGVSHCVNLNMLAKLASRLSMLAICESWEEVFNALVG